MTLVNNEWVLIAGVGSMLGGLAAGLWIGFYGGLETAAQLFAARAKERGIVDKWMDVLMSDAEWEKRQANFDKMTQALYDKTAGIEQNYRQVDNLGGYGERCVHGHRLNADCKSCGRA
jgi:hypothetical protein